MEAARVWISLPFRMDGPGAEHPGCLQAFDSRHIDRFLAALELEIRGVAGECGGLPVREIVLGNGSAAHFPADDLTRMVRLVREHFSVSPQAKIRLTMTPSGFDFYKLSAVKQLGGASICFEIPGLTDESLRAGGYRCSAQKAADALNCCFQNGFRDFSVLLTAKTMEPDEIGQTLAQLLAAHPGEILLRRDAESDFVQAVDGTLAAAGWVGTDRRWYKGEPPLPVPCTAQIGCGPGAVSVFDGLALQSTADFDFYCAHADDFEALVRHAQENP